MPYTDSIDMLTGTAPAELSAGVTSTTTSTAYDVSQRDQIIIQFVSTTGTATFSIDASNDGVTWTTGIAVQDMTSTNSTTYVTQKVVAAGSAMVKLPVGMRFIRCAAVKSVAGTFYAFMESSS